MSYQSKTTRPCKGWKHVNGAVWDHTTGLRLHLHGLAQLADGSLVNANAWPESRLFRLAERITGSRKRGLMVWALWRVAQQGKT